MYRNACLVLVLLLVTFPAMALGVVVIEGGRTAQSLSVPPVPSVVLLGRLPVLIPGWVRDTVGAFADLAQAVRQLPD